MKLKFVVNRMRSELDGERDLVECVIERPDEFCKKVVCYLDTFDENVYNRFCASEVSRIVTAISGLELGYGWFFEYGPAIVKEV